MIALHNKSITLTKEYVNIVHLKIPISMENIALFVLIPNFTIIQPIPVLLVQKDISIINLKWLVYAPKIILSRLPMDVFSVIYQIISILNHNLVYLALRINYSI